MKTPQEIAAWAEEIQAQWEVYRQQRNEEIRQKWYLAKQQRVIELGQQLAALKTAPPQPPVPSSRETPETSRETTRFQPLPPPKPKPVVEKIFIEKMTSELRAKIGQPKPHIPLGPDDIFCQCPNPTMSTWIAVESKEQELEIEALFAAQEDWWTPRWYWRHRRIGENLHGD